MIRYSQGDLLAAPAEALVNTVNEVGVMGKGIARMFRETFPEPSRVYEKAAKEKRVHVGHVLVTPNDSLIGPKWIIHFPTKKHWRHPSKLEWVRDGLQDLVRVVRERGITSIALPPLGCGNGGLEWTHVRREIESAMGALEGVDVLVFEPSDAYVNAPKRSGLEELTPARAMVVDLVRRYSVLGLDCTILEIQKLAWFLERALSARGIPSPLGLKFGANRYGPYSDPLRHLLDALDGSYLHCEKRLSDATPHDVIWFDPSRRTEVEGYLATDDVRPYREALEDTAAVIEGFESPLGMELLATVDWLLSREHVEPTVAAVRQALSAWPGGEGAGERKARIFDDRMLAIALERLGESSLAPAGVGGAA